MKGPYCAITARQCAEMSVRAYRECTFDTGSAEVLIDVVAGCLVVAWRGTEDVHDAVRDARVLPTWVSGIGFCHRGFNASIERMWPKIFPVIADSRLPVVFTGHSKGGAEASQGCAWALREGLRPAGLVTFGAPRPGFRGLRQALAPVPVKLRYVHGEDLVPRVPWLGGLYVHPMASSHIGRAESPLTDHSSVRYQATAPDRAISDLAAV